MSVCTYMCVTGFHIYIWIKLKYKTAKKMITCKNFSFSNNTLKTSSENNISAIQNYKNIKLHNPQTLSTVSFNFYKGVGYLQRYLG